MKFNLPKSFRMMKLLNHNHGPVIRAITATVAYIGARIATGRHALGIELASRFWTENDFKLGMRRGAWYARRSWMKLDVSKDEFFDPTSGMSDRQLEAMDSFISARASKLDSVEAATDHAFIAARRLNNNSDPELRTSNIEAFRLACNSLLAQQYDAPKHPTLPEASVRKGDFPIEDAKQALSDFADLFPISQMPWFLVSGTFLGLIREGGFLAHDYDIDLGVFEDQIEIENTCAILATSDRFLIKKYDYHQSNLFRPDIVSTNPDIPYILKIVHVTGVHIDLFIHYRDINTTPAIYWHGSSLHRWENSAFELRAYQFYGLDVLGPADSNKYLTENYGDWRTPVTEFNCTTDTPNLALVPHPVAVVIFLKRYVIAQSRDPAAAAQLERELLANKFLVRSPQGALTFSSELFGS